ncbi:MAG TPA: beta galactosidase jelly roll domain-containing protein [Bacteroidota bacterium]
MKSFAESRPSPHRGTSPSCARLFRVAALFLALAATGASAQDTRRLLDLAGEWKFEAGDNMRWAAPGFDDRSWDSIHAPGAWEDQGYPGYDGYAWYRKHFTAPAGINGRMLLLRLGAIDDADEVYLNGTFVGFTGLFPPSFVTAYNQGREYQIPAWLLKQGGDNVVAVRVYDDQMAGGITHGDLGIYEVLDPPYPDVSLDGMWKLRIGDSLSWSEAAFDDSHWESAYVPAYWETQGHKGYDGPGWYRLHVNVPEKLVDQRLLLLLGRIDDFDETYLNGQRIGRTGSIPSRLQPGRLYSQYRELRAYTIPMGLLRPGPGNVIAVRVFDNWLHGGIYRGPVGFISRERWNRWRGSHRQDRDFLGNLKDFFLN